MAFSCIKTNDHITVVDSETGESGTVNADHSGYENALQCVREYRYIDFLVIANPVSIVHRYNDDRITIEGGVVTFDNEVLHGTLAERMIDMIQDGFGIEPLANFLVNLSENPSYRAVTELYGFLEKSNLTITEDGYFVAYKKVSDDYLDCYSKSIDNSVGEVVSMKRNKVNENKDQTCSDGLHFCSRSYLDSYSGPRTMVLKINPRDVVSIPSDYNDAKGRCCKYEVINELTNGVEDGQRTEEKLEGSVYTGTAMPAKFNPDTAEVYDYYDSEKSARDAIDEYYSLTDESRDLKYWDFGKATGLRYAVLYTS